MPLHSRPGPPAHRRHCWPPCWLFATIGWSCTGPSKSEDSSPATVEDARGTVLGCFEGGDERFECSLDAACRQVVMDGHIVNPEVEPPSDTPEYRLEDEAAYTCFFTALASDTPASLSVLGTTAGGQYTTTLNVWLLGDGSAVLSGSETSDDAWDPWNPTHVALDMDGIATCGSQTEGAAQWTCLTSWWMPECLDSPVLCPN